MKKGIMLFEKLIYENNDEVNWKMEIIMNDFQGDEWMRINSLRRDRWCI